jgi:hypothetical protein
MGYRNPSKKIQGSSARAKAIVDVANLSKFITPKPRHFLGWHIVSQLTLHLALVAVSFADQRKICGLRSNNGFDKDGVAGHG